MLREYIYTVVMREMPLACQVMSYLKESEEMRDLVSVTLE